MKNEMDRIHKMNTIRGHHLSCKSCESSLKNALPCVINAETQSFAPYFNCDVRWQRIAIGVEFVSDLIICMGVRCIPLTD